MDNFAFLYNSLELQYSFYAFIATFILAFFTQMIFRERIIGIFSDLDILYKLTASFIFVALIPSTIIAFLTFYHARRIIVQENVNNLENIAQLKKLKIEDFFANLEKDMVVAQDYFNVKNNLPILNRLVDNRKNPEYLRAKKDLDGQLLTFRESKNLLEFILLNNDEEMVYNTGNVYTDDELGSKLDVKSTYKNKQDGDDVEFSSIFKSKYASSGFEMVVAAPAYNFEGEKIGSIVFAVDMAPVYDFIQDTTGLGETGETLIGVLEAHDSDSTNLVHKSTIEGPHVIFLNPLRHDPESALNRETQIGSPDAVPIQKASQGEDGSGISIDYRNKEVVAAWKYIPKVNWGLVAKIDVSEELHSIYVLQNVIVAVVLLALFIVFAIGYWISKAVSTPISLLSEAMSKVNNKGMLESEVPFIKPDSDDEVGRLTKSFKMMVLSLRGSSDELSKKLEQLEKFRKLTVGRELKMIELKKKLEYLEDKGGTRSAKQKK